MLGVRPALEHPNVSIRTRAVVTRLETNAAGTAVERVIVERDDVEETYDADIVVVSAGAANSAKILLASANDRHPNGLANGSGQVGRNYMFHNSVAVLAISKEPNPTMFQKTLGVNDFYFGMTGFDYPMGNIQMVGKSDAEMFKGEKPLQTKLAPMFSLTDVATHAVDFWLSTEDLPAPDNRVTLTSDGKIRLTYTPNNQEPKQRLYHQLKSMLGHLGMHPEHLLPRTGYLKNEIPIAGVRPPGGHRPVRHRPGDLGPRRQLQGPRARQPVRRRHELLPEHRRREPGPDGDGQRAAGGRPPPRAARQRPPAARRSGAAPGRRTRPSPASMPQRWLSRGEVGAVYGAGLVQGVALVTFPAASSILTSPDYYGLTSTAYGSLFLPQAVAAIVAALARGEPDPTLGIKRIFILGLIADFAAMALLFLSQFAIGHGLAGVRDVAAGDDAASASASA